MKNIKVLTWNERYMTFKHVRNTHKPSYSLLFLQSLILVHPPLMYHIQHIVTIAVPPISNGNTLIEVSCLFPDLDTRNEAEDRPTIPLRTVFPRSRFLPGIRPHRGPIKFVGAFNRERRNV